MAKPRITAEQWDIICFAEQYWRENGFFPTLEELVEETNLPQNQVEDILFDELTKKHLEARGININQTTPPPDSTAASRRTGTRSRLTDIQLATVSTILNPADKRSLSAKLESLGVPAGTYAGWKKSKPFAEYMKSQANALYGEFLPDMEQALIKSAVAGDIKAIKFAYEVSGRYRPQQGEEMMNVKMLIIQLIEVIQRHVHDPLTLQNIAQDIQELQQNQRGQNGGNQQTRSLSP